MSNAWGGRFRKGGAKFGNIPTRIDGHLFHSKKEAHRYLELKAMQGGGLTLSERIDAYWGRHVVPPLARLPATVPIEEKRRRRAISEQLRLTTQALIRDYDLEARLTARRRLRE